MLDRLREMEGVGVDSVELLSLKLSDFYLGGFLVTYLGGFSIYTGKGSK